MRGQLSQGLDLAGVYDAIAEQPSFDLEELCLFPKVRDGAGWCRDVLEAEAEYGRIHQELVRCRQTQFL